MATQNGVYETTSGDLLRAGFGVSFATDGSFDGSKETIRTDVPFPAKVRGQRGETLMHRWDGFSWILVSQPVTNKNFDILRLAKWRDENGIIWVDEEGCEWLSNDLC